MGLSILNRRSFAALVLITAACTHAPFPTIGPDVGKRVVADHAVVAAGNAYATEAGLEMIRRGGNAVDAAVATAFALGVTEPMMSGLGAGGGMLLWNAKQRRAEYLDFYNAAGSVVDTALRSLGTNATPRGVAIPGAVRGLLSAHAKYGKLSRETVMGPAIRLASEGFTVNALLAREIVSSVEKLKASPDVSRLFMPGDNPLKPGDRLIQSELAATLNAVAAQGPDVFYAGSIGDSIVQQLRAGGSTITREDFAAYQPQWRRPVCTTYHGRVVLSADAPQSGMQVLEALNLLADKDLPAAGLPSRSPAAFRTLSGAMRIAVADRDAFVGDPAKVAVPLAGLTNPQYAASRASLIEEPVTSRFAAGNPWTYERSATGDCVTFEPTPPAPLPALSASNPTDTHSSSETTHISVIDSEGNAVSLTTTLGLGFGTGTWVHGVFFNSAMFNFSRTNSGPNAAGPFHVPASTIAPTLVLRNGRIEMVVGCPGSLAIPPAIVSTIVYLLDYKLDPLQALRMPRMIPSTGTQLRMEDGFSEAVYDEARRLGYDIAISPPTDMGFGGVHVIMRSGSKWIGAADPRRDGEVRGF